MATKKKSKHGSNGRWARYLAAFLAGEDPPSIARRFKVSPQAVHKAIRAAKKVTL